MAKRGVILGIGVVAALTVLGGTASAQTVLVRDVHASGGTIGALSTTRALSGTIGQVIQGTVRHPQPGNAPLGVPVTDYQGFWVPLVQPSVSVDDEGSAVAGSDVSVYPNPMSTSAQIVLHTVASGPVALMIHDLTGNVVRTLQTVAVGETTELFWDGRDNDGVPVASGAYICRVVHPGSMPGRQQTSNVSLHVLR